MPIDRKTIADELADQSRRRKKLIEGAIAHAALDPPDLRMTTEQLRYALEGAAERWANAVDRVEARHGKGWLSSPAAAVRLDCLCVVYPNDPDFRWMADVLFTLGLPRGLIEREASGEDGIWNRKLRKTKFGKEEMELNALANFIFEWKEAGDRTEQNRRYRDLKAKGEALIRLVRADPTMGDIILGRAAVHGPLKTNFSAPRRETPAPEAKDQCLCRAIEAFGSRCCSGAEPSRHQDTERRQVASGTGSACS
jgi:hypothetical protein